MHQIQIIDFEELYPEDKSAAPQCIHRSSPQGQIRIISIVLGSYFILKNIFYPHFWIYLFLFLKLPPTIKSSLACWSFHPWPFCISWVPRLYKVIPLQVNMGKQIPNISNYSKIKTKLSSWHKHIFDLKWNYDMSGRTSCNHLSAHVQSPSLKINTPSWIL